MKKVTSAAQKLKELVYRTAPSIIREQLEEYLRCLKEGTKVELLTCSALTVIIDCLFLPYLYIATPSQLGSVPPLQEGAQAMPCSHHLATRRGAGYALLPPPSYKKGL